MSKKRDLVVIGGGAGGLVVASVASQLGLDVVLINKEEAMGGDCLHYGCVPSKALLKSASVAHVMSHADRWGLTPVDQPVDISKVNQAVKKAIDTIQVHDSRERFESLGCEVVTGDARFTGSMQVSVDCVGAVVGGNQADTKRFDAKRFVIATGSSVFIPPIKGLDEVGYLTNEDMFSLPVLPKSMIVLGGGPVGVEMAQAYSRLGTKVTIVELAPRLISRMDEVSSKILADVLTDEGVSVLLNSEVVEVSEIGVSEIELPDIVPTEVGLNNSASENPGRLKPGHIKSEQIKQVVLKDGTKIQAETLLVAIGRRAVVESLNLESTNVSYDAQGIKVNKKMQTTNKRIYACGDVTGEMPLTHVAELQAGIVIANMIFKLPKKISYDVIPSVVYTEPEVAQVGMTVEQCKALKHGEVYQFDVSQLDRAITDNNQVGIARILTDNGRIIGAHIIAPHAGEMIHELALAVQEKMKVSQITSLVHAYPSYSQLNKRLAGQYYSDRLFSSWAKKIVAFLNRFTS